MRKKENYIKHSVLQKVYGKKEKEKPPEGGFLRCKSCKKVATLLQIEENRYRILQILLKYRNYHRPQEC